MLAWILDHITVITLFSVVLIINLFSLQRRGSFSQAVSQNNSGSYLNHDVIQMHRARVISF